MIIRVRGVPGSGKTHIAKVLRKNGIRVIDTDDVISKAYDDLAKTKSLNGLMRPRATPVS